MARSEFPCNRYIQLDIVYHAYMPPIYSDGVYIIYHPNEDCTVILSHIEYNNTVSRSLDVHSVESLEFVMLQIGSVMAVGVLGPEFAG